MRVLRASYAIATYALTYNEAFFLLRSFKNASSKVTYSDTVWPRLRDEPKDRLCVLSSRSERWEGPEVARPGQ